MYALYLVVLGMFGAIFGSFVCCQVRRMRCAEEGRKVCEKNSVCLKCGYRLRWYDNIPIVSWLCLGGKCRKCKSKIGVMEIAAEACGILGFVIIGMKFGDFWDFGVWEWTRLGLFLAFFVILLFLALYDGRFGELPTSLLVAGNFVGGVIFALNVWKFGFDFWEGIIGVGIFGGLYFLLYKLSGEKLVGSGDYLLGTAIALTVSDWWLVLFVIFLSNFLASIVMLPVTKGGTKTAKIYFGPWMVVGWMVVFFMSEILAGLLG